MKFVLFLLLCGIIYTALTESPPKCYDKNDLCHSTNYESYISCVKRRYKRSTDCEVSCDSGNCVSTCDNCNCDSCGFKNCQNSCNSCCSSCCNNYVGCRTNHCCHKTCHAQCDSFICRSECRKNCNEIVKKADGGGSSNTSSWNDVRHNVTTIIHLNNVVNNTNVIDIPITINNTHQHNISLNVSGSEKHNSTGDETCCTVISPRQCMPHHEYPFVRCFHFRSKQCGNFCTSAIVHEEHQRVCQPIYPGATPNCQQQVLYIPQPQPRCAYQSVWPYVTCGIQNSQSASCAGCYNHYVNENSTNHLGCSSGCYDDGFGIGPYYRQGPFYRPGYSHVPCYPCFGYQGFGGYAGYGGYGGGIGSGGFGGYPPYGFPGGQFGVQIFPGIPGPVFPGVSGPAYQGMSLGSWAPPVENGFENKGPEINVSGPFDPLISVGPGLQYPYVDPLRDTRDIEIEVKYEPSSSAQAEVKIKPDKSDNTAKTTLEDDNLTTSSSIVKKLS